MPIGLLNPHKLHNGKEIVIMHLFLKEFIFLKWKKKNHNKLYEVLWDLLSDFKLH